MSFPSFPAGFFPVFGSAGDKKPNVTVTKFGEGYELRVPEGINTNPAKWTVQFEDTRANIATLDAFLSTQGAVTPFIWTAPDSTTITVVCRAWKPVYNQGYGVLTGLFEQVFEQ
jgi:phage-related protein